MDKVRPFRPSDRDACLGLFDGNVPRFFSVPEREGFASFLDHDAAACRYEVIERNGRIVGCGGLAVEPDGITASICWDVIDGSLHGQGLGRRLIEARLKTARSIPGVTRVRLDTSQYTTAFYARFGFETVSVDRDGYASGLDRCEMVLRL